MIIKRVDLYEYFGLKREVGYNGYLTSYVLDDYDFAKNRVRPATLIVAGGGYSGVSERESEPVAVKYLDCGFNCFTLKYSVAPACHPTQLIEGAMAMAYIRENAEKLRVDSNHVVAIGFSAGAHLCGMLASMFEEDILQKTLGEKAKYCRPDAVVLGYPVVSGLHKSHLGSFRNLCGEREVLYEKLSIELRINERSTPAFIWGTVDDPVVPSENGLALAVAYRKAGVPFEYHLFESCNGVHGLSICEKESGFANDTVKPWVQLSKTWLKNRGFMI